MLSYKTVLLALLVSSSSLALPIRREVPQEHSHQAILTSVTTSLSKNNPDGIVDPVFGLLGNAAAAAGLGKITDVNCLQQATADQAFTNAKAAGDVQGMSDALTFRALERNTGTVGGASAPCTSIKAVNPEIAAIQQHQASLYILDVALPCLFAFDSFQDPASPNAAAVNKAIVLELAKQIASIGGNPQDALRSGTFAPGNTADATADEINAAVAGAAPAAAAPPAAAPPAAAAVPPAAAAAPPAAAAAPPAAAAAPPAAAAAPPAAAAAPPAAAAAPPAAAAAPPAAAAAASSASIGNFGKCSVPQIEFGVGFDNRQETSFRPVDTTSFNHGSAQAIGIITQFICDTLTNSCGADATAKATCAAAQAAAGAAAPKEGIDADTFNGFFGIATNFLNVQAVDDQGNPIAGSTGGSVTVASA
ncbi:hypothetical protein B0H16DRAFT_1883924 [Mycena metata]|uniref:Uncharacterized protein n=1 Tax=Mycena metata TaxID=1033252 RepID=A0AAD7NJM6_9AGAR|nr:hypothetical protein B0H16DRAFT_1883924 [Mycena metata]